MSALRRKSYSDVLRPSAAKTKLRAAYSPPMQIAFGGLISGMGSFISPLVVYMIGSWVAQLLRIPGPDFIGRMEWLIDYFGLHIVEKIGGQQILLNFLALMVVFGFIGIISAIICRASTAGEGSTTFFMRRVKFPYDVLPFLAILLVNSFSKPSDVLLGFLIGILMGTIWKFYYGKVLSVISTVDTSKVVPDFRA